MQPNTVFEKKYEPNNEGNVQRSVHAPTSAEYNATLNKFKCYKVELVAWVGNNELEHCVTPKFGKERRGGMNNNVIKSWTNWMTLIQPTLIPWLVDNNFEKLGKKMDKYKQEINKWTNEVS